MKNNQTGISCYKSLKTEIGNPGKSQKAQSIEQVFLLLTIKSENKNMQEEKDKRDKRKDHLVIRSVTDILTNLAPGECVVVGDAVLLPAVVQMPLPKPEPHSQSVCVHKEWKEAWRDVTFADVITRWRKE